MEELNETGMSPETINDATVETENAGVTEETTNAAAVETEETDVQSETTSAAASAMPEAANAAEPEPEPEVKDAEPAQEPAEEPAQEPAPEPVDQPVEPAAEGQDEANNEPAPEMVEEPEVDYSAMSREELLAAFKELMELDLATIRNRASTIRNQFNVLNKEVEKQAFEAFLAEGGNKDDYHAANDPVAEAFFAAYDVYRARRQKMQEEMEAQKQRNLQAKQQILDELRALIDKDDETLKQTYDEFNAIQDKWKGIGEVPREQMNDLWQNYHFLIEQFFNKVKINKELRMLDLKRNLEQKIQLCERAEELIVETSVLKAFKALQGLRAQWKEIGPVPAEQNEETWQRFNNAANQIDERRREYYDQRKDELEQNLLAKQALIEKAVEQTREMPQSAKQWNDTTEALDELLKLWKSIGPVPREQNEEVWGKFKGIIDKHYADKKLYFAQLRDEQGENYNKKLDLCLRAEAIAKREDWKNATEELLQLQEEWKNIGSAGFKQGDKVWKRFRRACDEFFAKKGEYYKSLRSSEGENLVLKNAIIEEMKTYEYVEDRSENWAAFKEFQRRWAAVGHVPKKHKDRVTEEYHNLVRGMLEQLKASNGEARTETSRRVQGYGDDDLAGGTRGALMKEIEKLRSELNLWENNLGFFASSKQADLLKEEFEKKMQAARQQIALLQAKLRIMDEEDTESDN